MHIRRNRERRPRSSAGTVEAPSEARRPTSSCRTSQPGWKQPRLSALARGFGTSFDGVPHPEDPSLEPYDDPDFSYPAFWKGREYEHGAELAALRTLLGDKRFALAADIGGGYGRLTPFLSRYAEKVLLIEPSVVQRTIARRQLPGNVDIRDGSASCTGMPEAHCDLVTMVRVMHHLPGADESIAEIRRVLKPGGFLVLEFANSLHAKARLQRAFRFKRTPIEPVRVNRSENSGVPFVNHHPKAVYELLKRQEFVIEKVLSVSNLRSAALKAALPLTVMLKVESATQAVLGHVHFGPSMFVLARRM